MASGSSKVAVYAAIAGNFAIAVAKFTAALFTGSSAMLSEGIHSLVETILLTVDVEFDPKLSAAEVETTVDRLEEAIHRRFPRIKHIYIEAGAVGSRRQGGRGPDPG